MDKLDLKKAEEPEIKSPISVGSQIKLENTRKTKKTSTSASLMLKPLMVWITTNCEKFFIKGMEILDHLICLLRNLYADQEATVRAGQGLTDWFKLGKRVC